MTRKTRMSVSRRTVLAAAATGAAFGILHWRGADAAEFNLKLGNDNSPAHPMNVIIEKAIKKIKEESGGRLSVKNFPNDMLGTDDQMITQVRSGALALLVEGNNILAHLVPAANYAAIPFAFDSYEQAWSAMDGPLGKYIHAQIEKIGLVVFDKDWEGGFRSVFDNKRNIFMPADMKGLKLRVPSAPIEVGMFKAIGASPTAIDISELYSGLRTGLVDGGETALTAIWFSKLYEVAKHISLTHHQTTDYSFVANRAVFERLPKKLQEILMRNFNEAAVAERAAVANDDAIMRNKLQSQGVEFVIPYRPAFKEAIRKAGLYAKWRDTYGAEGFTLLEKAVGKLT